MKPTTTAFLVLSSLLTVRPGYASGFTRPEPVATELREEIISLLQNKDLSFLDKEVAVISVEFLVNARNEVVVLDVGGIDEKACAFVKRILSYKIIKFKEARQLTPYTLDIRLVRKDS